MTRIYYEGDDAVVTSDAIAWLAGDQPEPVRFADMRLRDIFFTPSGRRRPRWRGAALTVAVLAAAVIVARFPVDAAAWITVVAWSPLHSGMDGGRVRLAGGRCLVRLTAVNLSCSMPAMTAADSIRSCARCAVPSRISGIATIHAT